VCIAIGIKADRTIDIKMNIGDNEIPWVSELKYLGVHFKAARALDVNIIPTKYKFMVHSTHQCLVVNMLLNL
jgi:hypothetical protein